MFLIIDNYDSFTYNLYHYLGELGVQPRVIRNDTLSVHEIKALTPKGIILSPGPCTPNEAGICLELIAHLAPEIPILGVCLGHQSVAQAFGARIVRIKPMHGKISSVNHNAQGVFANVPTPFSVARYHSLAIAPDTLPDVLNVTANSEDGVIMGIQHVEYPVYGVQFHPESIASEHGKKILQNFLSIAENQTSGTPLA